MLNSIRSELYKIRKSRISYVCFALVILAVIWVIYKDMILTAPPKNPKDWIPSAAIITALFLSIASGFVITFLVQQEYEYKTLINVLTAPTSRIVFILSKIVIWFLWYLFVLAICILIFIIGGNFIYPGNFGFNEVKLLLQMVAKPRIFSFIASMPLIMAAVMQKHTFYPAIMCSLGFTGMELFSTILPVKYSCMIPWTAVTLTGYDLPEKYLICAVVVIFLSGIIGISGACIVFRRQNQ